MSDPHVDAPPPETPSLVVLDYGRAERWDYQRVCRVAALGVGLLCLLGSVAHMFTRWGVELTGRSAVLAGGMGLLFVALRTVGTERPWTLVWKLPLMLWLGYVLLHYAVDFLEWSDIWFDRWSLGREVVKRSIGVVVVVGVGLALLFWQSVRDRGIK